METSLVQALKLFVVQSVGLSKDALHIYVGMAVFLLACSVLRASQAPVWSLFVVLVVASAGELLDLRDDIASLGGWRWKASLHDLLNTLFWPLILTLLSKMGLVSWPSRNCK